MSLLCPDEYLSSVLAIDLDELQASGIRTLFIDLDNTLLPRTSDSVPDKLCGWVALVKERGFSLCLISNNWHERVSTTAAQLDIPLVCKAVKPLPFAFWHGFEKMACGADDAVFIGDQLFTDILGAHIVGMKAIMVLPLAAKDLPHTLFLRKVEKVFMKDMKPSR
ncbi:MAG: YqeG family HAD IIIA-type phosphatase [Actinobacteria bacterium]|nr:YqeG family HAD IIIA-type phosphatase [Actinomycetota bacterium]